MSDTKHSNEAPMNLYEMATAQFQRAADAISLDPSIRAILTEPKNEISFNFPVRMDNGHVRMFKGYRIQHNNILGPYKGGIRFHHDVDIHEVKALAAWMTWKTSLAGLPFGGAKGGVTCRPSELSRPELERLTRRFTHALGTSIGTEYDIPAPDVGTNSQIMDWMMDTHVNTVSILDRTRGKGVVTGKSLACGGSKGREKATGQGVCHIIDAWAKDAGVSMKGLKVAVQGFGNVGYWTCKIIVEMGAIIVAVMDHTGAVANPAGIDVDGLKSFMDANKKLPGFTGAKTVTPNEFWGCTCDVMVPAAIENQITGATAPLIKARVVVEGANGPTTTAGDADLARRGITVIPDILANSGGVIVSFFEWLQNRASEYWELEEVDSRLKRQILEAYSNVTRTARERNIDLRTAAYAVALLRIAEAYRARGVFP